MRGNFLKRSFRRIFSIILLCAFGINSSYVIADVPSVSLPASPAVAATGAVQPSSEKSPTVKKSSEMVVISPATKEGKPGDATQSVTMSPDHLISLDYNNANLSDVLKAISYSYNVNIVATKDMSGKVSAKLNNLTLDEALNAILTINKYAFTRKGGIIHVMPKSEMELAIESIPLNFLNPKEATGFLGKVTERGSIQANEATNSLIVKADPSEMENIKQILKTIDMPPIQVLIEAKIVDINTNDLKNIGTNIKLVYDPATGHLSSASLLTGGATTATAPATNAGLASIKTHYQNISPEIQLDALVTQNKARILAAPSIATLNGKAANITIGSKIAYIAETAVTGSTSTTSTAFADVGTKLEVTPTVSLDGWITMKIHPEVSSLLSTTSAGPNISTREADATVRVKNNQTIVIGGLINRSDLQSRDGVPYLRDIPVLGWFFKRHKDELANGSLTVFITPHIIPMPSERERQYELKSAKNQDVEMLDGLLRYADGMELDRSADPAKNVYLNEERIKAYRMIIDQFPQSSKMDYCLYKIAFIYAKEFGRCDAARETLMELKSTNSESSYIEVVDALVNACFAVSRY